MSATSEEVTMEMDCEKHTNYFHQLPDEMVMKIFSNLHQMDLINVAEVCEKFKNVVNDGSFWKSVALNALHLKIGDFDHMIKFPIKELVMTNCDISPYRGPDDRKRNGNSRKKLDKLVLSKLSPIICQYVTKKCNPKHLIMNDVSITIRMLQYDLQTDFKSRTILEVISMRRVVLSQYCSFRAVVDVSLCKNLKEVDLGNARLSMEVLRGLMESLPESVERLMWGHALLTSFHGFETIFDPSLYIKTIVRQLPNLKLLGVAATYIKREYNIGRLANLQFLNTLRLCYCESSQIIKKLVNILPHLHQVRTIQFVMRNDVTEESKQEFVIELNESKRQLTRDYSIDFEVQYIIESICEGHNVDHRDRFRMNFYNNRKCRNKYS